jgi:hypothetical protein
MAPNKTRNAGRQLLVTRNRQRTEKSAPKRASLKRIEAGLLLELGQKDAAVAVAASLAEENLQSNSHRAFLADILARAFMWREAEAQFAEAHRLCLVSGNIAKAHSIASGALFLLAEARGDYNRCYEIAPYDVLRWRACRLMGEEQEIAAVPSASPWMEIAILEKAHRGGSPLALANLLTD